MAASPAEPNARTGYARPIAWITETSAVDAFCAPCASGWPSSVCINPSRNVRSPAGPPRWLWAPFPPVGQDVPGGTAADGSASLLSYRPAKDDEAVTQLPRRPRSCAGAPAANAAREGKHDQRKRAQAQRHVGVADDTLTTAAARSAAVDQSE